MAAKENCYQEPFKTFEAVRISWPRKIWVGDHNAFPPKEVRVFGSCLWNRSKWHHSLTGQFF